MNEKVKYIKQFSNKSESLETTHNTPFVATIDGDNRVMYASKKKFNTIKIVDDNNGFIKPINKYSSKLIVTADGPVRIKFNTPIINDSYSENFFRIQIGRDFTTNNIKRDKSNDIDFSFNGKMFNFSLSEMFDGVTEDQMTNYATIFKKNALPIYLLRSKKDDKEINNNYYYAYTFNTDIIYVLSTSGEQQIGYYIDKMDNIYETPFKIEIFDGVDKLKCYDLQTNNTTLTKIWLAPGFLTHFDSEDVNYYWIYTIGENKLPYFTGSASGQIDSDNAIIIDVDISDDNTETKEYIINDDVYSIGVDNSNADRLRYISIPDGVTKIWDRAFAGCTNLTSIDFPNSIEYIGDSAFINTEIESFNINASEIARGAFYGCGYIKSVIFGEKLKKLGNQIFYNTGGRINYVIFLSKNVPTIDEHFDFDGNSFDIYVPDESYEEYCELFTNEYEQHYKTIKPLSQFGNNNEEEDDDDNESGGTTPQE